MVKYVKNKSGKITAVIWEEQKDYSTAIIAGTVLLAVFATAIAWWKTNQEGT